MPDKSLPEPTTEPTVADIFRGIIRDPGDLLWRRWNWKSALFSTLIRGAIFFSVNLIAGVRAAVSALLVDFLFRPFIAGFYGAVTESFRMARPQWAATMVVALVLPAINHLAELGVHWAGGTKKLGASVITSVGFSVISGLFNLFAMRRGVMIVGDGRRSMLEDFRDLPFVIGAFLIAGPRLALSFASGQRWRGSRESVGD